MASLYQLFLSYLVFALPPLVVPISAFRVTAVVWSWSQPFLLHRL